MFSNFTEYMAVSEEFDIVYFCLIFYSNAQEVNSKIDILIKNY